jgi:hypothetical protein
LVDRRDLLPITEAEAAILQPGALSPPPARPPLQA